MNNQNNLLAKVLLQQKLNVVNLYHLHNATVSILQDVSDELKEIIKPEKNAKKVANDFTEFLEKEIRKMQEKVGDEQLQTLENNECMKEVLQKIIEHTKKGTVLKVLNLILDFEKESKPIIYELPAQLCKNCKNYPVQSMEQHWNCKACNFIGNQQTNFIQK